MKTKRQGKLPGRLVLIAQACSLAIAGPALAQDNTKQETDAEPSSVKLERVEINGIRSSLDRAAREKQRADNVVDVLSAQDIGKFTDQNVAEALQRVPGVQIQRDANGGEGTTISVRGLGPELNRYTINGRTGFTGDARAFDFSNIPTELVSSVQVFKTPTSDMDEGGLGATVNVVTRRPTDLKDFHFASTLQGQRNDLAGKTKPRASIFGGGTFFDGQMGLILSAAYSENSQRYDQIESFGWSRVTANMFTDPAVGAAAAGAFRQTTITPALVLPTRKKTSAAGAYQWKVNDSLEFNADVLYTKQKDIESLNQLVPQFQNSYPDNYSVYGGGITQVTVDKDNTITHLEAQNLNLTLQNAIFNNRTQAQNSGLNFKWHADEWTVNGDLAFANARQNNLFGSVVFGGRFDTVYDATRGGIPSITYYPSDYANATSVNSGAAPVSPNDPSAFVSQGVQGNLALIKQSEVGYQLDAERKIDSDWIDGVKFGVKYRPGDYQRDYYIQNVFDLYAPNGAFTPFSVSGAPAVISQSFPVSNFGKNIPGSYPRAFPNFNFNTAMSLMETSPEVGSNFLGTLPFSPLGSYKVKENVTSGYVRGDFSGSLFGFSYKGNAGLRMAHTEESSSGYSQDSLGNVSLANATHDYTDFLPSANIKFDLPHAMLLRLAAAKVMTRPSYQDLSPGVIINDVNNRTATQGNPNLSPFRASQFDATLEYYGNKGQTAAFGVFYKDISSFISQQTVSKNLSVTIPGVNPGDPAVQSTQAFQVTTPVNGKGATILGSEMAFNLPLSTVHESLSGFGLNFNYTFVHSDAHYVNGLTHSDNALEGLSKNSYNVGAYFDQAGLNLQLSYTWRSNYVYREIGNEGNTEYAKPMGFLYASASYDINKSVAVTVQGINLTGQKFRLYSDIPDRLRFISDSGRSVIAGVRVKF
ncbi:MAG TPA: TonB-dependent receptor [Burkholderiaceae bacterium]|jgi:TonB-dependent receptor